LATNLTRRSATGTPFLTGRTRARQASKASAKASSPTRLSGPPLRPRARELGRLGRNLAEEEDVLAVVGRVKLGLAEDLADRRKEGRQAVGCEHLGWHWKARRGRVLAAGDGAAKQQVGLGHEKLEG
jgi:hypothetical protein